MIHRRAIAVVVSALMLCLGTRLAVAEDKAAGAYQDWAHSGSLFILTTPEGTNLPATASEQEFPLLVWLNKDWFDFKQAKPAGEDIRFSSDTGVPLKYQIEEWDAANGTA